MSTRGDLADWSVPGQVVGGIGGAADIAVVSVTPDGLRLAEAVEGPSPRDVRAGTGAPPRWDDVRVLTV